MDSAAQELAAKTRRVIGLQMAVGALVAAGFFLVKGPWEAWSAAYGGLVSIVLVLLLSRGVTWAGEVARHSAQKSQLIIYASAALRFVLVLALFGLGLAGLDMAPLATVLGFVAVQVAFLVAANRSRPPTTE